MEIEGFYLWSGNVDDCSVDTTSSRFFFFLRIATKVMGRRSIGIKSVCSGMIILNSIVFYVIFKWNLFNELGKARI